MPRPATGGSGLNSKKVKSASDKGQIIILFYFIIKLNFFFLFKKKAEEV
jgi:hypothetical protein